MLLKQLCNSLSTSSPWLRNSIWAYQGYFSLRNSWVIHFINQVHAYTYVHTHTHTHTHTQNVNNHSLVNQLFEFTLECYSWKNMATSIHQSHTGQHKYSAEFPVNFSDKDIFPSSLKTTWLWLILSFGRRFKNDRNVKLGG